MRKEYVSINEMGTAAQNPRRENYMDAQSVYVPPFNKGKTSIDDIEKHIVNEPIIPMYNEQPRRIYNERPKCSDIGDHLSSCALCRNVFMSDPLIPIMIITILISIIIILVLRLNTK